ncbi:MAG: sigma-70 family RNA polymerase sigma factor [Prolixibacteraceae bacterium]|nr:sigma-70 family RNA polymerase sigma factor [Prolixibacteraceae bacterium]
MLNDSTIWNDFRGGKGYALPYIYSRQVEHLYRYGRKFTNDEELIKDTIQEMFYHLIRSRDTLGETDNIRFYLMSAFKHRIIRRIQSEKHVGESLNENDPFELKIEYSYEDELIGKETERKKAEVIRKVLKAISPRQREILYYRYSCDYSYEEICKLMSMNYDSARKMVFRALKSLREHLDPSDLILLFLFKKN